MKIREKFDSRIPKLLQVGAITLYPFIFYGFPHPDDSIHRSWEREIRQHEWVHIDQIRGVGFFRFYLSYFIYYLAGRIQGLPHYEAYLLIPYEVEARAKERTPRNEYV